MEPKDFYLFSLEDKFAGPYRYGPHHTGIVGAILVCGDYTVWWGPYRSNNVTGMDPAYLYGPHYTGMVGAIRVWPSQFFFQAENFKKSSKLEKGCPKLEMGCPKLEKGYWNLKKGVLEFGCLKLKKGSKTWKRCPKHEKGYRKQIWFKKARNCDSKGQN